MQEKINLNNMKFGNQMHGARQVSGSRAKPVFLQKAAMNAANQKGNPLPRDEIYANSHLNSGQVTGKFGAGTTLNSNQRIRDNSGSGVSPQEREQHMYQEQRVLQYNAQMQRKPPAATLGNVGRPSFSTIQAQQNPQPSMAKQGGKSTTNRQSSKQAQQANQAYKGRTTRPQASANQFQDPRTLYPIQLSNERSGSNETRMQQTALPPQIYHHQNQYQDFEYQRQMMRQSPEIQNLPQNISMNSNLQDRHMNTNPQQYYRYLEELNQYPPAQQKVLIDTYSQQSPPKMASQPHINDFQSHQYMLKESSNPRFDLPRQIMQQNYMDATSQQRLSQPPIRVQDDQSSSKRQLLEKYYSSKYEQQSNSSDIQKFIDFYKHFSSQQAQNIAQSRETPQPDHLDYPQPLHGHQSPSSDSSDKKIQQMLMHMKKDVEECKQYFMKEKRSLSDRGSSNRREHSGDNEKNASDKRGKSIESKKSNQQADASYKRRKAAPPPKQPEKKDPAPKQRQGKNSNERKQQAQQLQYKSGSKEAVAAPPSELVVMKKELSREDKRPLAEKTKETVPQGEENMTPKKTKIRKEVLEPIEENKAGEQGRPIPSQACSEVAIAREMNDFTNLNIAKNLSDSDDENQQRIFQFSPLSSKKQLDEESEEEKELSQRDPPDNFPDDDILGNSQQMRQEFLNLREQQPGPPTESEHSIVNTNGMNNISCDGSSQQLLAESTGHFQNLINQNSSSLMDINQGHSSPSQMSGSAFDQPMSTPHLVSTIAHQPRDQGLDTNSTTMLRKAVMIPQEAQTEALLTKVAETQTLKQQPEVRNLSPFETYDFLFIRDLVNNLNKDNEILHDNSQDLKTAFMFLLNEHKQLQFQLQKEKRNQQLVVLYRDRVTELTKERDQALEYSQKMKSKVEMLNDIIQVAVEEQQQQRRADDVLVDQLLLENEQLRGMLKIAKEAEDATPMVEGQIEEALKEHELSIQRTQDQYLLQLREEEDIKFAREIDEHKEIIQRIYDEKLQEKTEEIQIELTQQLTSELTEQLTQSMTEQMTEQLRESLRDEIRAELKNELTMEISKELQLRKKQSSDFENNQTTTDLGSLLQMESTQPENMKTSNPSEQSNEEDERMLESTEEEQKQIEFQNEKSKFIQEMMKGVSTTGLSSTLPPKSGNLLARENELRKSQQSSGKGSEPSGQSDDWNSSQELENQPQYNFEQIFEDQALSQEEEELFNQLKQREKDQKIQGTNLNNPSLERRKEEEKHEPFEHGDDQQEEAGQMDQNEMGKKDKPMRNMFILKGQISSQDMKVGNSRYYQHQMMEEEEKTGETFDIQEQEFERDPNELGSSLNEHDERPNQHIPEGSHQDTRQFEERPDYPAEQSQIQPRNPRTSSNQVQGFQGQAVYAHYNQQFSQGQARGSQREGGNVSHQGLGQDGHELNSNQRKFLGGQGFQGQGFGDVHGESRPGAAPLQPVGTDEEEKMQDEAEGSSLATPLQLNQPGEIEEADEYDDFYQGINQKMLFESNLASSGMGHEMPDNTPMQEDFDGEFEQELVENQGNIMDSTKGLSNMMSAMRAPQNENDIQDLLELTEHADSGGVGSGSSLPNDSDEDFIEDFDELQREEGKEEEYDYFLDAHKEENMNANAGYHIIDQEELERKAEEVDEDDLDQIEDKELREYRYQNMLEDLKDKIQEEEEND